LVRRAGGAVEVHGGIPRRDGGDFYQPREVWVVTPDRLDAVRAVLRQIETMLSACSGADDILLARAKDTVNVSMVEEMQRVMKGAMRLDHWLERGLPL
jgi:hypothetical protein